MTTKQKIYKFFSHLGVDKDQIELEDKDEILHIDLDLKDKRKGLFIGRHARTLDALQRILSFIINNQEDEEHQRILLDVANYRKDRLQKVQNIAEEIAKEVLEEKTPTSMPRLSSTERRHIHMHFSDHEKLTTFSQGEGQNRRLFIAPQDA